MSRLKKFLLSALLIIFSATFIIAVSDQVSVGMLILRGLSAQPTSITVSDIYGSSQPGENLRLHSTSNSIKGKIYLDSKIMAGTVTGFDTPLQTLYLDPSVNIIGLRNPSVFTQALLSVAIEDNTGNSQNTGLFVYDSTPQLGTTVGYGNGIEGDVLHRGPGTTTTLAAVTSYSRVYEGAVTDLFDFWSGSGTIEGGTVSTWGGFYTSGKVVSGGHLNAGYGGRFYGPMASGTGTIDESYGIYVAHGGNGTLARNAYFGTGIVEVADELLVSGQLYVSGTIQPKLAIGGSRTLVSATDGVYFYPNYTVTGNNDAYLFNLNPTVNTPNSSSITNITSLRLDPPIINLGSGVSLLYAINLYIPDAPSAGTNRYALYVGAGTSHFGGTMEFGTYAAKGAEAFAGYITIKDSAGNSRKVMICE